MEKLVPIVDKSNVTNFKLSITKIAFETKYV